MLGCTKQSESLGVIGVDASETDWLMFIPADESASESSSRFGCLARC